MKPKLTYTALLFSFSLLCSAEAAEGRRLIVFYSPSCRKCIEVKSRFIPKIQKQFAGRIWIDYRDISEVDNYKLMLSLQKDSAGEKTGLPVFYLAGRVLGGESVAEEEVERFIKAGLTSGRPEAPLISQIDLASRFKTIKMPVIAAAGLFDGINPCAFTVVVFFISFLGLQGYQKKQLIVIGVSFICAVFLTYLSIGLGLFNFIYHLRSFWLIQRLFNLLVGLLSIALGFLALADFFKYRRNRDTAGLILMLPAAIKNKIHSLIGRHYRRGGSYPGGNFLRLVISAFSCGFLVSLLEAVCTGQVYLPTIAFVLKAEPLKLHAWGYILLYNLLFILPLLVVFLVALWGVTALQFGRFFKRHLLAVKLIFAVLFFGLGYYLIIS